MYFPGNYRWSAGLINMLSSAPYGGSEIGELHKIGRMLKGKAPEDDEAWFDACVKVADGVPDLVKRGISCLVMDGPGTGEAIRFREHYLRHDYEVAGSACIDWLEQRDDVNPKKIGIVAISLGGYYTPRCAALEPRFAACIA